MGSVQPSDFVSVFAAMVYRPHHVRLYANGLDEHVLSCGKEFSDKIIMGDFNAYLIEPNAETRNPTYGSSIGFIDKHSLKVIEHGVTHHTRTNITISNSLIDLILVDSQGGLLNFKKFLSSYEKNGQDIITATIKLFVVEPSEAPFSHRDYRSIHP